MELFHIDRGVLASKPDSPSPAGTRVDAEFLSRSGDSSQERHDRREILTLGMVMGLLPTVHRSPAKGADFCVARTIRLSGHQLLLLEELVSIPSSSFRSKKGCLRCNSDRPRYEGPRRMMLAVAVDS